MKIRNDSVVWMYVLPFEQYIVRASGRMAENLVQLILAHQPMNRARDKVFACQTQGVHRIGDITIWIVGIGALIVMSRR